MNIKSIMTNVLGTCSKAFFLPYFSYYLIKVTQYKSTNRWLFRHNASYYYYYYYYYYYLVSHFSALAGKYSPSL